MVILALIVSIIFVLIGVKFINDCLHDDMGFGLIFIGMLGLAISVVFGTILITQIANGRVIDEKITMYQEENNHIETQIAAVVSDYQKHEEKIFTGCKTESSITMVSLYPELKSDELVKAQIDIYLRNNEIIKSLRENKIKLSVRRWLLYFGK